MCFLASLFKPLEIDSVLCSVLILLKRAQEFLGFLCGDCRRETSVIRFDLKGRLNTDLYSVFWKLW
ncbi:hypothetical protein B9Q02_07965 [Candidatus Marsarchaeota G1 archaeon BE_D]|uniref:Uncharacterized protein n=1 Tax=Candidatus Marsarchaeota G1 archaeon BE_D TaxID=1978156 RepID=A0A2R6AF63_9ARCH|nr:MAG: hypothetical protein B9Q02_07965 [Candidatus Marsarchaeota G1 archaeon BE_D]